MFDIRCVKPDSHLSLKVLTICSLTNVVREVRTLAVLAHSTPWLLLSSRQILASTVCSCLTRINSIKAILISLTMVTLLSTISRLPMHSLTARLQPSLRNLSAVCSRMELCWRLTSSMKMESWHALWISQLPHRVPALRL